MNMPTLQAQLECAQWLTTCLAIGWRKSDLDFLEKLWWQYHNSRGKLVEVRAPHGEQP